MRERVEDLFQLIIGPANDLSQPCGTTLAVSVPLIAVAPKVLRLSGRRSKLDQLDFSFSEQVALRSEFGRGKFDNALRLRAVVVDKLCGK